MAKTQTLAFPVRLPDAMQPGALRLLQASREAINAIVTVVWPDLVFSLRTAHPRSVLALLSTAAVRKRVYDSA